MRRRRPGLVRAALRLGFLTVVAGAAWYAYDVAVTDVAQAGEKPPAAVGDERAADRDEAASHAADLVRGLLAPVLRSDEAEAGPLTAVLAELLGPASPLPDSVVAGTDPVLRELTPVLDPLEPVLDVLEPVVELPQPAPTPADPTPHPNPDPTMPPAPAGDPTPPAPGPGSPDRIGLGPGSARPLGAADHRIRHLSDYPAASLSAPDQGASTVDSTTGTGRPTPRRTLRPRHRHPAPAAPSRRRTRTAVRPTWLRPAGRPRRSAVG
ncbi:hypothetical protein [Verrucosispora sioxanthis]|uniref:hypothetical protein n=1 Tax=Verrucosispora sioxanthis TaxID=2499994 RepID=UPI001C121441|nr:hypothetical protein [Verrucosispora sioxanthis]